MVTVSAALWRQLDSSKKFRHQWADRQMSMSLAMQIRELRLSRKWSQAELGRRAGIAQSQISRLESGFHDGSIDNYLRIASVCDVAFIVRFDSWNDAVPTLLAITQGGAWVVPQSFDEEALGSAVSVAAVDPHVDNTGKPSTRAENT